MAAAQKGREEAKERKDRSGAIFFDDVSEDSIPVVRIFLAQYSSLRGVSPFFPSKEIKSSKMAKMLHSQNSVFEKIYYSKARQLCTNNYQSSSCVTLVM